jgi:D-alanine-D-alanine ligase
MRVLVLHSDVPPDAPADDQDTLETARAIAHVLEEQGHRASPAPFLLDPVALERTLAEHRPDIVFNMVESIFGQCELAPAAPALLEKLRMRYTGCPAAPMALAGHKPLAKRMLRLAHLPTPDWSVAPFDDLPAAAPYIVKSATEDASLGLDSGCVVTGRDAVVQRAEHSHTRHGGQWFAEAYIEGREFNISVLEENGQPRVLPIPEMAFENWQAGRPKVVGYAAKWEDESDDSRQTVRRFIDECQEPALLRQLTDFSVAAWRLFGLRGFARVDFRVDEAGRPTILELNPNPCLEVNSGFAAAAAQAGMSYGRVIARILDAAC